MHHYQCQGIPFDGIIIVLMVTELTEQVIMFGMVSHGFLVELEMRDIIY